MGIHATPPEIFADEEMRVSIDGKSAAYLKLG